MMNTRLKFKAGKKYKILGFNRTCDIDKIQIKKKSDMMN